MSANRAGVAWDGEEARQGSTKDRRTEDRFSCPSWRKSRPA